MKKNILLLSLLAVAAIFSCKEETIKAYNDTNYVSFDKKYSDTTSISFFFYQEDEIEYPLYVKRMGKVLDYDVEFNIETITDRTTLDKSLYLLPSKCVFRAGLLQDTLYVKLKNSADLATSQYRLQLKLTDGEGMASANSPYSISIILLSDMAARPSWWTLSKRPDGSSVSGVTIQRNYLGDYSNKKYETFMRATGVSDLSEEVTAKNWGAIRIVTLKFQHWLDEQDPKILDEDGNEMKTVVIG